MTAVDDQADELNRPVQFHPRWWSSRIPAPWYPAQLDTLPSVGDDKPGYRRINRHDVFALAADDSPAGRVQLLVAAYAWGTGPAAFVVGRRARVFTRNDLHSVGQRLQSAAQTQADEGPVAAYTTLLNRGALHSKYLGPSFFTKFMYFAAGPTPQMDPPPLILDRYVAAGLNQTLGWSLGSTGWSPQTYARYLRMAMHTAAADGISPEEFEARMFQLGRAGARRRRSDRR